MNQCDWAQYGYQTECREGFVYLWMYREHLVKIGFSKDPKRRLMEEKSKMRRGKGKYRYFPLDPEAVVFLASIPGTEELETDIQDDYPGIRVPESEWFVLDCSAQVDFLVKHFPTVRVRES